MLWAGVKIYVEENLDQIKSAQELFGQAWPFIVDLNFAGEETPSVEGWWKDFGDLIPEEKQREIERIRRNQSPRENAFEIAIQWLNSIENEIESPNSNRDWEAVPEVLYWSSVWKLSNKAENWVSQENLSLAVQILPLENLSELFLGIYLTNQARYSSWMNTSRTILEERFAQEYDIVAFEEKDEILFVHFLTYPEELHDEKNASTRVIEKSIHDKTIERLKLIRQFFPSFPKFGSQGYGHQIAGLGLDSDDSTKSGVDKKYLIPKWPVRLNGIAIGLAQHCFRPYQWDDYFQQIIQKRQLLVDCFSPLPQGIARYFAHEKPFNLFTLDEFQHGEWYDCMQQVNSTPLLPKRAVDPWGMAQPEGNVLGNSFNLNRLLPASVLDQIYKPYLEAERKYFSSMRNFMEQSVNVVVTNYHVGKLLDNSPQKNMLLEQLAEKDIKTQLDSLSFFNLSEGRETLSTYQTYFRRLFGHRIDNGLLTSLEHREIEAFNKLWPLWYYFATRPRTSVSNALRQIPIRIENIVQNILRRVIEGSKAVHGAGVRSVFVQDKINWDSAPAIFVMVDVENTTLIYPKVEEIIQSLRKFVGIVAPGDLEYRLIDENFRFIVIVATVQGNMINALVWPLRTVFTIITDDPIEKKLWAYIPQELPKNIMDKLGLTQWKDEEINLANQVSATVFSLRVLLNLISAIKNMPEPTEAGLVRLNAFMDDRSKDLSKLLQLFINSSTKLLERFNNLSEDKQAERIYLNGAVTLLNEIYKNVLPGEGSKEQEWLDLNGIIDYQERLRSAISICERIKLLWVEDIIENISSD